MFYLNTAKSLPKGAALRLRGIDHPATEPITIFSTIKIPESRYARRSPNPHSAALMPRDQASPTPPSMPGYSTISRAQSLGYLGLREGRHPTTLDLAFETALLEHMPLLDDPRDLASEDTEPLFPDRNTGTLPGPEMGFSPTADLFAPTCIVFSIPAAYVTVACIPVALRWICGAEIKCYFEMMLAIGLVLDMVFCLALMCQLLRGVRPRDAILVALRLLIQVMCVLMLAGICGCELWLLAQGGVSAGVAF